MDTGTDFWPQHLPPTPPLSPHEELFPGCNNEQETTCEYIGKSALQFSRSDLSFNFMNVADFPSQPIRQRGPRPIRSASERSSTSSSSGSSKDEPRERTKTNPRSDPRYDVKADNDGLFHCPFAGTEGCTHQPTKQKCIYAYVSINIRCLN